MNVCGSDNNLSETIAPKVPYETVPYKGKVGEKLFKFLKSSFKKLLPNKCDGYQTQISICNKREKEHQHHLVYHAKCHDCDDNYIEEVGRRLGEHVCDHSGKDHKSHMLKHSFEKT